MMMSDFAQKYRRIILFVPIYVVSVACIFEHVMCGRPSNYALEMVRLLLIPFTLPFYILINCVGEILSVLAVYVFVLISLILKFYDKVILPKLKLRGASDKFMVYAPYSLLIYLMLVVIVAYGYTAVQDMHGEGAILPGNENPDMGAYRIYCDALCSNYIDANFDSLQAVRYCEKYFEIDLNRNGKILSEAAKINAFGVCEDRVYCLNIRDCRGSSENSRLTPERCRDIMCDVYTERYEDADMASAYIAERMNFGSCDLYDPVISFEDVDGKAISIASWWIDNFQDVDCSGE